MMMSKKKKMECKIKLQLPERQAFISLETRNFKPVKNHFRKEISNSCKISMAFTSPDARFKKSLKLFFC